MGGAVLARSSRSLRSPVPTDTLPRLPLQSFCYKAFHYSSHKEKSASRSPSPPGPPPVPALTRPPPSHALAAFGDSNAASIVDGGIGRAFRNTNVESDGIDANDGTLKKFTEDEQANKGGLGKNY